MVRSNKADTAQKSELDKTIAELPKKKRIQHMLVAVLKNNDWLTITDLSHVASRGYIYNLMKEFRNNGWIEERQKILKGRRTTGWRATEQLVSYVSLQDSGQLPRSTEFGQIPKTKALAKRLKKKGKGKKPKRKIETVKVIVQPTKLISDHVGIDQAYTEHIKLTLILDSAVAERLREKMNPPSKGDNARQYTLTLESITLTLSNRDKCVFILNKTLWADELSSLCVICGIPNQYIKSLVQEINLSIPDGFARVEFPVFMQQVIDLEVTYEMITRILDEDGKATGFVIESNINHSMLVDYEVLGKVYAVNNFLSTMSAMQHTSSVAYATLKLQEKKEAEDKLKALVEKEAEMLNCSCVDSSPVWIKDKYICQHCGKQVDKDKYSSETNQEEKDDWKQMFM